MSQVVLGITTSRSNMAFSDPKSGVSRGASIFPSISFTKMQLQRQPIQRATPKQRTHLMSSSKNRSFPMHKAVQKCILVYQIPNLLSPSSYNLRKKHKMQPKRERNEGAEVFDSEATGAGPSKRNRPTSANSNALALSCELLRIFVTEAVQRAAIIAEAEGSGKIEATHLERILPQLLLDF
ncbi:hypothetical protein QQ045_029380 [Rhodiola kirilowii]